VPRTYTLEKKDAIIAGVDDAVSRINGRSVCSTLIRAATSARRRQREGVDVGDTSRATSDFGSSAAARAAAPSRGVLTLTPSGKRDFIVARNFVHQSCQVDVAQPLLPTCTSRTHQFPPPTVAPNTPANRQLVPQQVRIHGYSTCSNVGRGSERGLVR
jgi:hypothetical protein